jgi:valyl-tRNA synthetase
VEANRNFANKIWNVTRFIISNLSKIEKQPPGSQPNWTLADSWIWARLQALVRDVERLFQNFQYGEAGRQIYEFFWSEFADWYIEVAKHQLNGDKAQAYYTGETLVRVLDICLRLLHPFTPFVTEELWGHLKRAVSESPLASMVSDWSEALIIAPYPESRPIEDWETKKIAQFKLIQEIVRAIRNLRSEKNVEPAKRIPALLISATEIATLQEQIQTIIALSGLDSQTTTIQDRLECKPEGNIALVIGTVEVYLPLSGLVNINEERKRLKKDLDETESQIERLKKMLSSEFAEKAPEPVVNKERQKLTSYQETAEKIRSQLMALSEDTF